MRLGASLLSLAMLIGFAGAEGRGDARAGSRSARGGPDGAVAPTRLWPDSCLARAWWPFWSLMGWRRMGGVAELGGLPDFESDVDRGDAGGSGDSACGQGGGERPDGGDDG